MDVKHTPQEKQSPSKMMTEKLIRSKTYNTFVDKENERRQMALSRKSNQTNNNSI